MFLYNTCGSGSSELHCSLGRRKWNKRTLYFTVTNANTIETFGLKIVFLKNTGFGIIFSPKCRDLSRALPLCHHETNGGDSGFPAKTQEGETGEEKSHFRYCPHILPLLLLSHTTEEGERKYAPWIFLPFLLNCQLFFSVFFCASVLSGVERKRGLKYGRDLLNLVFGRGTEGGNGFFWPSASCDEDDFSFPSKMAKNMEKSFASCLMLFPPMGPNQQASLWLAHFSDEAWGL